MAEMHTYGAPLNRVNCKAMKKKRNETRKVRGGACNLQNNPFAGPQVQHTVHDGDRKRSRFGRRDS